MQGARGELGLTLGVEGASGELAAGGGIPSVVLKGENLELRRKGLSFLEKATWDQNREHLSWGGSRQRRRLQNMKQRQNQETT